MIQPTCSAMEESFREKVWRYHEKFERLKMLRYAIPQSRKIQVLESKVAELRKAIEQDKIYVNLDKTIQKQITQGKIAKLLTNDALCTSAGVSSNYYRSMFKYGSNHTHSSPFSYAQMDEFNCHNADSLAVFRLALKTSTGFLALAIRDFVGLFPDQLQAVGEVEKQVLEIWGNILTWENDPSFGQPPSHNPGNQT